MPRYRFIDQGLLTRSLTWDVQRTPYVRPLPFSSNKRFETQFPSWTAPVGRQVNDQFYTHTILQGPDFDRISESTRVARDRWVSKMKGGASAALGLTIMDWRTSHSMLRNAFITLAMETDSYLGRRNFYRRYGRRKASDLFLEGVFGWLPLMSDIYQAYQVLSRAHPAFNVGVRQSDVYSSSILSGSAYGVRQVEYGVQVGGSGRISNPNIALLNDLGLINPLSVAWDKVPYSFVVNWFLPVGNFLNSLTDLVGYEVSNDYTTTFSKVTASGMVLVQPAPGENDTWRPRTVTQVSVNRTPGLPSIRFPSPRLPTPDLMKSLISFSLLDVKLRQVPRVT